MNQAQTGVNMVLRLFLRSPFIVVGAVIMSFTIDVKIGLIFLIAVPVISIVIYGIMRTNSANLQKGSVIPGQDFPDHQRESCGCQSSKGFWKTAGRI